LPHRRDSHPRCGSGSPRVAGVVAGAFCAAGFVAIELLSDGAITRAAMNTFPPSGPSAPSIVTIHHDRVTKKNLSEFNQDIAILALLALARAVGAKALDGPRRKLLTVLFFLALAVPIAISEHDSSQVGLIASLLILRSPG